MCCPNVAGNPDFSCYKSITLVSGSKILMSFISTSLTRGEEINLYIPAIAA
jgi:hypothetical protein